VAHNIGASHVRRRHRITRERFTTFDDLSVATVPSSDDPENETGDRQALARLMILIHALAPAARQVMLLYLEGLDATASARLPGSHPAESPRSFTDPKRFWPANSRREAAMPIEPPADAITTLWHTQSREIEAMQLEMACGPCTLPSSLQPRYQPAGAPD
jgi:hypothetical protein